MATVAAEKKKKKKKEEFEFCKVCNLNHDQGRRHNFFPNHTKALSSFLSRFRSKLSDVRFFLKNPTPLRPEHASLNRLWCVFCDSDIRELGGSFSCSNAIEHLASADHLRSLKHFLWKYGGGMDRIDAFRISEEEFSKWEGQCKSSKITAVSSSEASSKRLFGPSNNIHDKLNYDNVEILDTNTVCSNDLGLPIGVMPLPYITDKSNQISKSGLSGISMVGSFQDKVSSLPTELHSSANFWRSNDLTVSGKNNDFVFSNGMAYSTDHSLDHIGVHLDKVAVKEQSSSNGLENPFQASSVSVKEVEGNVHSGAPPPWFDTTENTKLNFQVKLGIDNGVSSKMGKSKKLNPKRVGAAWAEKRKIELEMEKRGEIAVDRFGDDWLPNFGRVWQSGSRKESRKEFESEKPKLSKTGSQSEMPIKIEPYISKRMRRDVEK